MKKIIVFLMVALISVMSVAPAFADSVGDVGGDAGVSASGYCIASFVSHPLNVSKEYDYSYGYFVSDLNDALKNLCFVAYKGVGGYRAYDLLSTNDGGVNGHLDTAYHVRYIGQNTDDIINNRPVGTVSYDISIGAAAHMYYVASASFNIFLFDTADKARTYLRYCIIDDFDSALQYAEENSSNFEQVQNNLMDVNKLYSSSIPTPSKFYISNVNTSSVSVAWEYSSNDFDGILYDLDVEYFYTSESLVQAVGLGWTGKSLKDGALLGFSFDSYNRVVCTETVEAYLENRKFDFKDYKLLVSENVDRFNGSMQSRNVIVANPVNYGPKFDSVVGGLTLGATSSMRPVLCGAQATITPYIIVDGQKVYGNKVVTRRFVQDVLNSVLGCTVTEIGEDDNGNPFIASEGKVDSNGDFITDVELPEFQGYLNSLFSENGLEGYIDIMRTFFSGIPVQIWVLISLALVIGIFLMVFRYI